MQKLWPRASKLAFPLPYLCSLTLKAAEKRAQQRHRALAEFEIRGKEGDEEKHRHQNLRESLSCTALAQCQLGCPWIGSRFASPPPKLSQTAIRTHAIHAATESKEWGFKEWGVVHLIPGCPLKHVRILKRLLKMSLTTSMRIICIFYPQNRP